MSYWRSRASSLVEAAGLARLPDEANGSKPAAMASGMAQLAERVLPTWGADPAEPNRSTSRVAAPGRLGAKRRDPVGQVVELRLHRSIAGLVVHDVSGYGLGNAGRAFLQVASSVGQTDRDPALVGRRALAPYQPGMLQPAHEGRRRAGVEIEPIAKLTDTLPVALPEDQHHEILRIRQRSEEHTSELQSRQYLVCRLL